MLNHENSSIVLASGNVGKIREIQVIFSHCRIIAQSEYNVIEADETGSTFVENAIIKAKNAARQCRMPAIADDSGLVVDALDGAPGVISARYAGAGSSDRDNVCKLLAELEGLPFEARSARFICVMVFMAHADDPCPVIAEGIWEGKILNHPAGSKGFGYDPIFWVPERNCASAELPADIKNSLSHRGQALKQLGQLLQRKNLVGHQ